MQADYDVTLRSRRKKCASFMILKKTEPPLETESLPLTNPARYSLVRRLFQESSKSIEFTAKMTSRPSLCDVKTA